jgi:predicted peroxiredoxin
MANRRAFLKKGGHFCAGAIVAGSVDPTPRTNIDEKQRFFVFTMVGSENPTRANVPFVWAAALREMGHEVRMELAGDATVLMRTVVTKNVSAVGWPPLSQAFDKVVALKIPIFV